MDEDVDVKDADVAVHDLMTCESMVRMNTDSVADLLMCRTLSCCI